MYTCRFCTGTWGLWVASSPRLFNDALSACIVWNCLGVRLVFECFSCCRDSLFHHLLDVCRCTISFFHTLAFVVTPYSLSISLSLSLSLNHTHTHTHSSQSTTDSQDLSRPFCRKSQLPGLPSWVGSCDLYLHLQLCQRLSFQVYDWLIQTNDKVGV